MNFGQMFMTTPLLLIATSYAPPSALEIAWRMAVDVIAPLALVGLCDTAWLGGLDTAKGKRLKVLWISCAALYVLLASRADPAGFGGLAAVLLAFHATGIGARYLPSAAGDAAKAAAAAVVALAGAVMCFLFVWWLAPPLWTPSRGLR